MSNHKSKNVNSRKLFIILTQIKKEKKVKPKDN